MNCAFQRSKLSQKKTSMDCKSFVNKIMLDLNEVNGILQPHCWVSKKLSLMTRQTANWILCLTNNTERNNWNIIENNYTISAKCVDENKGVSFKTCSRFNLYDSIMKFKSKYGFASRLTNWKVSYNFPSTKISGNTGHFICWYVPRFCEQISQ